ncbi:ABC-2 type transport system permease protein [Thermoflavifilum aggregans]|uniref:Transport permease protein n=1 Tax=Thermoflavifilum aggregans TaxID=454188 RepID=A0A2M9CU10_9BACT|nr:ABC transporter permease [Thermoflavifilum aggregans]PJJ75410.1 ABC-2 type transport system permease protein [Thermoflavifilum aggregans]
MEYPYSQFRAMMAVARASFIAILKSPSAVVFSIAFPLAFILVFGFIGQNQVLLKVGFTSQTDVHSPIYRALVQIPSLKIVQEPQQQLLADLQKGRIDGILEIDSTGTHHADPAPPYHVSVLLSTANAGTAPVLEGVVSNTIYRIDSTLFPNRQSVAKLEVKQIPGRRYKPIDFILPGMLGFALLSAGIFGTAFVFFNLRQTLVLKRFFATPIKKGYIVLGEAIARVVFQLLNAIIIIALGYFVFGFTLYHGWITVLEMLLLSFVALIVFMGFGFIISSIARNESSIPPLANIVTLPQFLLAGTFFPIDVLPGWLQPICRIMPLSYLNTALRSVAFEGASFHQIAGPLLGICIWGVVIYAITFRVFRWE